MDEPGRDTVLIVDDEPTLLLTLRRMLQDEGCGVLTAEDGTGAQELLQAHAGSISVVVLDWMMPQMNGIEVLRWMKKQRNLEHIPVIMLTALGDPARVKEGIDAGAYYYLVKPFQRLLLNSILRAAVSDFHSRRKLLQQLKHSQRPFQFLVEGLFRFRTIDEAEHLAVMVASATPDPEHAMVIAELLLNAVEHGNLGITYEDKGKLIENNTWRAEVERRLALPENAGKHVLVRTKREEKTFRIEIEDEGSGFDYRRYLQIEESRLFDNHGRGIVIALSSLNVEFIGAGNKLVVTIPMG